MRYVQQRGITELVASVMKDGLVRAEEIPLVLHVAGAASLPRGARVKVRLGDMDLLMLEVSGSLVERLDVAAPDAAGDEEDDEPSVGVHLALDVNEENTEKAPENPT